MNEENIDRLRGDVLCLIINIVCCAISLLGMIVSAVCLYLMDHR